MRNRLVSHGSAIPFSLLYAALIIWFPWEELRGSEFSDIANYLRRVERIRLYSLDYFDFGDSILSMLSSEFAWSWLTAIFLNLGFTGEGFLMVMSGFSAFVASWFLARRVGGLAAMIMLLNPISIDLYASQIRSAVAFSVFLLAVSIVGSGMPRKAASAGLMVFTFFVHASMPLLLAVYAAAKFLLPNILAAAQTCGHCCCSRSRHGDRVCRAGTADYFRAGGSANALGRRQQVTGLYGLLADFFGIAGDQL